MALTLNKQTVNLVIDQGCTFEKVITAKNTAGGNVTISSGTCAGKLRPSHYTSNNVVSFTTADSGSNVTISLTATQTGAITPGQYIYDVEYTQSDETTVERLAQGIITISEEATK